MNLVQRLNAPTPKFFKVLRTAGMILAAIGGVIVATPVALPAVMVTIAGYLIVAGSVASAVSQAAVAADDIPEIAKGVEALPKIKFPILNKLKKDVKPGK